MIYRNINSGRDKQINRKIVRERERERQRLKESVFV